MPSGKIALLALLGALPAAAARGEDMVLPALSWPVGAAQFRLGAEAEGAVFAPDQPGRSGGPTTDSGVSGALRLMPALRRDYDSGLALGLDGIITAADPLSRGRYDGDAIERLAATARTGLGTLTAGISDGAGYALAVTGPRVDGDVSLDDPRTSFFRDPRSGRAVTELFALRTEVGASSNYAKLSYASPALFGAQLAISFTPSEGKQLPFQQAGPHLPGRQADIWEAALRYETDLDTFLGPVSLSGYGAVAEGRSEHKLPGQEGVSDLGAGLRADYPLSETVTASLGAAWRQSNAYGFNINQAWQGATTRAQHVSAALNYASWTAGVEFGNGVAKSVAGLPRLGLNGVEASLGYQFSESISASAGWQRQGYARDAGTFFNGAPQLKMDAVYLHLNLHTSEQ